MDERDSDAFKTYREYFKGRSIPFTVLIDTSGKARKEWVGFVPYNQMVNEILALADGQRERTEKKP